MRALSDIVQQFDPGRGPGRGIGSISGGRRNSARTSGRESHGRMTDLRHKMQARGESPAGRAERGKSSLMAGQGTHFQSSALRTHIRKDSGAYMDEDEYMYSRAKPSAPRRQDMGYEYDYGYEEEQMMPQTMRGTRAERQPMRYAMDQEEMEYMEQPRQMPAAPRTMAMGAAPQPVRYVVQQPRMEAAGASRAMGMSTGTGRAMPYEQPPAGMYRSAQRGGKATMKPHQSRQLLIEDQPRMQATAGAGRAMDMGMGYEGQPQAEVYRTSHIGGQPSTKQMPSRYIQEQPRMGTTEARVPRATQEQPRGQVIRKSHVGAQPAMRTTQRPKTVYVRKVPREQVVYTQKQPQRAKTVYVHREPHRQAVYTERPTQQQQPMYVEIEPQRETIRPPRVSGNMGQARMRYDQVPREPEPTRVPHVNGKPATQVPTGQQGMGYVQEQRRPGTVYIPGKDAERGRTRPVTTTSMGNGPSMRSRRNQRMSTHEPTTDLRRESTVSSRGPTGPLGVHDGRDAAVSAAAAAILGGKTKPKGKVTEIPRAHGAEYGAGIPRRESATLPERPMMHYDEDQYMEEPVPRDTGRLREDIYVPSGAYETFEREPPVVTETILPQYRPEQLPEETEPPRMAKAELEPETVIVNEPVTVGEPIQERVVLVEEPMESEEEMAREREAMMHEERMVRPSRLMESQPALTEQVVTEPVVEQEMEHPAIGMPDDEDIEREARMKQMRGEAVPGFEAREEVIPEEEAVEEEFQPAREIPSEESENEWDVTEEEEEEEVTEEYEIREPQQPPMAPLAAIPVMAHQTTATQPAMPARTKPPVPAVAPAAATSSTRQPASQPPMYEYQEVREPRAFEQPVTVSGMMPPGVPEPSEPLEEPVIESTTTTIPAAEPIEERYVSAKPSLESHRAIPVTTSARGGTVLGTMEPTTAAMHHEHAFETRACADAGATGRLHPDQRMRGTRHRRADEAAHEWPPQSFRTSQATVPGTMEPATAAMHDEHAFETRSCADAGATGRLHPDQQMRGTTRRSADYDAAHEWPPESFATDQQKMDMYHRRMAEEQAMERARGAQEQEEESEARARAAAVGAAQAKAGPMDTAVPGVPGAGAGAGAGTAIGGAGMGETMPEPKMGRGVGMPETGGAQMPPTGLEAAAPAAGIGAGAGAGAAAARPTTAGMNRSEKRRLEKEEKAREKQRAKEQKQYEQNRKAQEQRMAKERKEQEKQQKMREKQERKDAVTRKKSQEKETAQRRKSMQKEQRRQSEQARSSQGNSSGDASQGQSAEERERGLSGLWRRLSRTFTGEGSGSGQSAGASGHTNAGGQGLNQGTSVQHGAQQMQNAMGRPQDIPVA